MKQDHYTNKAAGILNDLDDKKSGNPELKAIGFGILALVYAVDKINETLKERFPKNPE
jgi:hypothetical protein